ncbi:speckle targeted PIP5K1A-regulated poly(A) polymerase [Nephila pilipes]|uniref:Speckle targeted PIP5K1A-regulated poly(A) polymerase n=1 Tax=Nephila pilipes TaxID=299642 RepID=A0A8X6U4C3_NEPPI|nr:speckle targeted PIP5K1A-regulated poly(A) polymerase [Nephila pilipes]
MYYNIISVFCNKKYSEENNVWLPYTKQHSNLSTSAALLKKHHTTKNWKYMIRDGKKPDNESIPHCVEEGNDAINHSILMSKLQNCSSVSEQIETFVSEISLSPEDLKKRTAFCKSLEEIFKIYFPKFKLYQFGSSVNGLGFRGCDLDLCLQTNFEDEEYVTLKDVPTPHEVKEGIIPPESVLRMTPLFLLRFIRRVLFDHFPDMTKILLIKARCPILRFYSSEYNIFCDFSCESKTSVRNTMILRLLGYMDIRFPTLTKIIRYWGKYGGFVGDIEMFNSYAFSLLVVHFLQTRNPPILPPIKEVVLKSEYLQQVALEDTELMFEDLKHFSSSKNSKTVEELLREFFFHYLTYDFTRIMQPSTSSSIPLSSYVPDEHFPTDKFEVNTLNIQDPFRPNFNVTAGPNFKYCKYFLNSLLQVCMAYQNNSFDVPKAERWGLSLVFNEPVPEIKMHKEWQIHQNHTIEILPVPDAASKLKKILNHVLLFNCTTYHIPPEKCTNTKTLLNLHCKAYNNTWHGRDWAAEKYKKSNNLSLLEFEHLISKELITQSNDRKSLVSEFTCELQESIENNETKLTVHLSFKESKPPILAVFLKEFIPSILKNFE